MPDLDPSPVAGGNDETLFKSTEGLPIRDVLLDVDVWRLTDTSVGQTFNLHAAGQSFNALRLQLVEDHPEDGTEPRTVEVICRFGVEDLAVLMEGILVALKPDARRALALAIAP